MPRMNSRWAMLLAGLVFVLAVAFSFALENYQLAVSGLLITIVLTVFVPGWWSTLIAGVLGMIALTVLVVYFRQDADIFQSLVAQLYSLLVILFAVGIVLYMKKLQQSLEYGKTHMTSLFENATEGILLTNRQGSIVLANPAAQRMFGYAENELIGHPIELLIPRRFHPGHEKLRDGFYQKPANRSMGIGRDLFARRKDDSEFPVEVSLSHYRQKNESYVIAFIVDITTRKEFEANQLRQKEELEKISHDIRRLNAALEEKVEERTLILKEALQKLEQSQQELSESLDKERQLNEIKSRFVSMASHEFRTPLSTILSSATLVSKYTHTEEQARRDKHINRIRESVNHMNDLLEDFLSLGKLEEGKVGITVSDFSVRDFSEDVLEEMKAQVKENQQIILDCQASAAFRTDKRMLKNIVLNLLSNAIKFSAEGAKIQWRMWQTGNELQIEVADQGLGIPEEDQPHLFGTFFRARNVSNIQGTGLGLPIIKRYVDLLKGDIQFESQVGVGTVFRIRLPRLDSSDMD